MPAIPMERKQLNSLLPDRTYPQHVFALSGQRLLSAGTKLDDRHLATLRKIGDKEVVLAENMEELLKGGLVESANIGNLAVGQKAEKGLLNCSGQILIEAGQVVEPHHMDALAVGEIAFTSKAGIDPRRERLLLAETLLDDLAQQARTLDLRIVPEAESPWLKQVDKPEPWPTPEKLIAKRTRHVEQLRKLHAHIEAGVPVPISRLDEVIEELIGDMIAHPHRFTQLALLCPRKEDYLPDHAYTTAVLAMAIAIRLRWKRDDVRQAGMAALLFDLGMLLIPETIRSGMTELSDMDRQRVNRHPVFSVGMLSAVQGVPTMVKLAVFQHHERENGSGYPQGLRRDHICDLARVLAVADVFGATTEQRQYRKQKLPYMAMEEMLRSTGAMTFWKPASRALLQAAGLFPVGSFVKLSDGRTVHIVASNPDKPERPVVQPVNFDGQPRGEPIDLALASCTPLTITRPVADAKG